MRFLRLFSVSVVGIIGAFFLSLIAEDAGAVNRRKLQFISPEPLHEVVQVPLRSEDTLCFANYEPDFSRYGHWPWGGIARDRGACQGMAATVAAFHEYAEFDPTLPPPRSASHARALIRSVDQRHAQACPSARKIIPGFANLYSFCQAFRKEMIQEVLSYNVQYVLEQMIHIVPELVAGGGSGLSGEPNARDIYDLRKIRNELFYVYEDLKAGRIPIMLVVTHVVAIYEMWIDYRPGVTDPDPLNKPHEILTIRLNTYNPNGGEINQWRTPYDWDPSGLPKAGSRRMWNITPQSPTSCGGSQNQIEGPFI